VHDPAVETVTVATEVVDTVATVRTGGPDIPRTAAKAQMARRTGESVH
jgi:hypothetical protein